MTLVTSLLIRVIICQWLAMTVELRPYGSGPEDAVVVSVDECGNFRDLEGHKIYAKTIMKMLADQAGDRRLNIVLTNEHDTSIPTLAFALAQLYQITTPDKRLRVFIHLKCLRREGPLRPKLEQTGRSINEVAPCPSCTNTRTHPPKMLPALRKARRPSSDGVYRNQLALPMPSPYVWPRRPIGNVVGRMCRTCAGHR